MTEDVRPAPAGEPVGSLAEEAGRLMAALGDWAQEQGPELGAGVAAAAEKVAEAARQTAAPQGDHAAAGDAACTWCPICRTAHAVRNVSPEVRAQLSVAATALLQAGTGLLASLAAQPGRPRPPGAGPSVQHIDLDEDDTCENDGWEA